MKIRALMLAGMLLAAVLIANAQSSGFTYQAVVRDANGNLVENANVGLRLTMTDQSGVPVMYQETLSATTNSYGVLSVLVGSQDTAAMNRVDWSRGVWMHVEVDPRGGTNYIDLGLTKLQAVPYAFYAANGPKVTKDPTDETVKPGESAWFVAKHTGAILARWHFVSPDGSDYEYTNEAVSKQFPQMKIVGGDQGTMQLQNIPLNANGWKVYCRYSNNSGTADTKMATITVQGATQATADSTVSAAATAAASTVTVNDWTTAVDLDAAVSISGVSFSAPSGAVLPAGTSATPTFRAKTGTLEANYSDANSLIIRKSTITGGNDLIGDYSNYSATWPIQAGALTVNCRGDGTTINAATCDLPSGYLSISYNMGKEGSGLNADQITSLVDAIQ